ncbi:MAG: hypothetical protein KBT04_02195 [Bacteroidales bacterium]|nr:hypothetical protein [Candidatus Colimorpha onthohippi]
MDENSFVSDEMAEAMNISQEALKSIFRLIGRRPTFDELNTLLAMWDSNGRQQSFAGWLRGQHQETIHHDYLYSGDDQIHQTIREPRIQQCLEAAKALAPHIHSTCRRIGNSPRHGMLLYMVGCVTTEFLDSNYAKQYLHIVAEPSVQTTTPEELNYLSLITNSLYQGGLIEGYTEVAEGGLFAALQILTHNTKSGFEILTCREVRLDSFLFGEAKGRFVVMLEETTDDLFLQKLCDARINCCFLGRITKGRIIVDGFDFGNSTDFCPTAV